jgi:hypothetical protein
MLFLENSTLKLPWLLIYDDVVEGSIDYPQRGGAVIITSQKKVVNPKFLLEVEPFSRKESLALL